MDHDSQPLIRMILNRLARMLEARSNPASG